MAVYKHGTYGEFVESIGGVATQSGTVPVYVGLAPVNLVRGYEAYVNRPVKLTSFGAVRRYMGYSDDWSSFDLCEAFHLHFNNADGNIGPIIAINVLDPAIHRAAAATTTNLTFANGRATIESDTIILDTLVLAELVEGVDFSIDYDYTKGQVIIESVGDKLTGTVAATYNTVDASAITAEDIIGGVTSGGVYTGLGNVSLIYQQQALIPSLLLAPGWSHVPAVYEALVVAGSKINGHWDAFVYADLPIVDGDTAVDTIEAAITWQDDNGYDNERSKVFWPQAIDTQGRIFHTSVLAAWRTCLVDYSHNGVPMESPSNKAVPIAAQYFGADSSNQGFDQERANELNAEGITTICYWGNRWALWGPHTAAYRYGAITDNRNIFDNSIRMMMYVSNDFQREWALTIDEPMTRGLKDTVLNREQQKMDSLAAMGAFIGEPVVEFLEEDNSTDELVEGNFTWSFKGTPTPPWKSGTLRVAYTTAGFDSYFEGVA